MYIPGDPSTVVSISTSFTLPGQPPSGGFANLVGLHGDGFTSPTSMYLLQPTDVGDASGGGLSWNVTMDPRYVSVVAHMGFQVLAASGRVCRLSITGRTGNTVSVAGTAPITNILAAIAEFDWSPPPLVDVKTITWTIQNVDTNNYTGLCTIYNFDKEAMFRVPLSVILASLPRGSTNTALVIP